MDSDESCGLVVKKSITLLGMQIDNELLQLHDNFNSTIAKMERVANFWSRFKLTLPGRIAIAKTFMLSLVNHLGCILMPLDHQINTMQDISDKFCVGTLKVSKERLYANPSKGGLGLIRIRDFLISQHTIWVKRASLSSRDNWRVDLHTLGLGNPLHYSPQGCEPQIKSHTVHMVSQNISRLSTVFFPALAETLLKLIF